MEKSVWFLVICGIAGQVLSDYEPEILDDIKKGYEEYMKTKILPEYYKEAVKKFQLPGILRDDEVSRQEFKQKTPSLEDNALCTLCSFLANFLVEERKHGMTREQMIDEITSLCVQSNIENERVCRGTIESNLDIFLRLMDKHTELIGDKICDVIFTGTCGAQTAFVEWNVTLPEGQSPKRLPVTSKSTLKILQITDLHYDPLYTPGKSNQCGEPLCCQDDQIDGNDSDGTACGYWGDYRRGDTSSHLFDEMLRQAKTLGVDLVYFTGDIISHRVWSTSVANNTRDIQTVLSKLKDDFPDIPIYSTLGNHEPHPLNEYNVLENSADENLSTKWLYQTVMTELDKYLPGDAKETIVKGGFYVVSPHKGLKVVVINSNVAQNLNWWLIDSDTDPFEQLAWLVKVLKEAEDSNESVHILSHFPPGYVGITQVWAREFNKIVQRFANTITLQLNGHTHRHEWELFYNTSDYTQVVNKAFNGGSVATYVQGNPNFIVYTVDETNYDLVDFDLWTFNLTEANLQPKNNPNWYKLYSFKDAYELDSINLTSLGELMLDMTRNHSRLIDYHTFRYKNSDYGNDIGCNEECQKNYLCNIATSYSGDLTKCNELKKLYDENY